MARTTLFSQESYQLQHQGNVGPITLEASFLLNREQFGMGHSLEMKGQFTPLPSPVVRLSPASDRHPAGCQKPEIQKLELRYLFS